MARHLLGLSRTLSVPPLPFWRRIACAGCMTWLWWSTPRNLLAVTKVPTGPTASLYRQAVDCFQHEDYERALRLLAKDETAQHRDASTLADDLNLQGAIFLRQHCYDQARTVLDQAVHLDPNFWEAQFNLAEVSFHERHYDQARAQLTALQARTPATSQAPQRRFLEYKLDLIDLLCGHEKTAADFIRTHQHDHAPPIAWYYLHAALEYQHRQAAYGDGWLQQADAKFAPVLVTFFTSSFDGLGWATGVLSGRKPTAHARRLATGTNSAAGSWPGALVKTEASGEGLVPAFRYGGDGAAGLQGGVDRSAMRAEFNLPTPEHTPGQQVVAPAPSEAPSSAFVQKYEAAVIQFLRKNYREARKLLDEADTIEPNEPQAVGLRRQLVEQDHASTVQD